MRCLASVIWFWGPWCKDQKFWLLHQASNPLRSPQEGTDIVELKVGSWNLVYPQTKFPATTRASGSSQSQNHFVLPRSLLKPAQPGCKIAARPEIRHCRAVSGLLSGIKRSDCKVRAVASAYICVLELCDLKSSSCILLQSTLAIWGAMCQNIASPTAISDCDF